MCESLNYVKKDFSIERTFYDNYVNFSIVIFEIEILSGILYCPIQLFGIKRCSFHSLNHTVSNYIVIVFGDLSKQFMHLYA